MRPLVGLGPAQYASQVIRDHIGKKERRGDRPAIEDLIDHDFIAYCDREADDNVTLDEVIEHLPRSLIRWRG